MFRENISGHCSMGLFPSFEFVVTFWRIFFLSIYLKCWKQETSIFIFEMWCSRCEHYRRRCKLRAPCCDQIFTCRHCHNEATVSLCVCTRAIRERGDSCFCSLVWIISAPFWGFYMVDTCGTLCRVLWATRKIDTRSFAMKLSKYKSLPFTFVRMIFNLLSLFSYLSWLIKWSLYDIRLFVQYAIRNKRFVCLMINTFVPFSFSTSFWLLWLWVGLFLCV